MRASLRSWHSSDPRCRAILSHDEDPAHTPALKVLDDREFSEEDIDALFPHAARAAIAKVVTGVRVIIA